MDVYFVPKHQHILNFVGNLIDGLKFETITGSGFFRSDSGLIRIRRYYESDTGYLA